MENIPTEREKKPSYDQLRNMFLPVKDNDGQIVRLFKDSAFYFVAVMMVISTLLLFAAVLIAA